MSVMVVQAGAARAVLERDPEEAAGPFARIEETGRTGLAEMRRLLGMLKADDDEPGSCRSRDWNSLDELRRAVCGAPACRSRPVSRGHRERCRPAST